MAKEKEIVTPSEGNPITTISERIETLSNKIDSTKLIYNLNSVDLVSKFIENKLKVIPKFHGFNFYMSNYALIFIEYNLLYNDPALEKKALEIFCDYLNKNYLYLDSLHKVRFEIEFYVMESFKQAH